MSPVKLSCIKLLICLKKKTFSSTGHRWLLIEKNTLLLCILFAQCFLSHSNGPSTHVRTMKGSVSLFSCWPDPVCWFQSSFAICVHSKIVPSNMYSFHTLGAFYMLCSSSRFPSGACFFCHFLCDSIFLWLFNLISFITSLFTIHFQAFSAALQSFHKAFVHTQVTPFLDATLLIPVYGAEVSGDKYMIVILPANHAWAVVPAGFNCSWLPQRWV